MTPCMSIISPSVDAPCVFLTGASITVLPNNATLVGGAEKILGLSSSTLEPQPQL